MAKSNKRRMRCASHKSAGRSWTDYYLSYTSSDGIEYYYCRECRANADKELARLEKIIANEKKQKIESYSKYWEKYYKRENERLKSQKEDLWDFVVKNELLKGMKLKGIQRQLCWEAIPKELIQLKRATMKLQRKIISAKEIKKNELIEKIEKERLEIEN